jgi:hypothetical protein
MDKPIQDSMDAFTESKKNINLLLNKIEKTSPKYHQSLVTLQQEYIDLWRTMANSLIVLEREYATQIGFLRFSPNLSLQIIQNMIEMSIQTYLQQNKFTLDITDTTKHAFLIFNQNTKTFFSLNKEIITYLIPAFEYKSKI